MVRLGWKGADGPVVDRDLHFNAANAYVKVFGGFQEGKNPFWRWPL